MVLQNTSPASLEQVSARLQDLGQAAVPVPVETIRVEALVSDLNGLEVMARVFHDELSTALGDRYSMTQAEVLDALKFVIELRIFQVRREVPGTISLRNVEFPAALLPIVLAIGVVDVDRTIEIYPALGDSNGNVVSFATWRQSYDERSARLETLVRYLSTPDLRAELSCLPKDIRGSPCTLR